MLNCSLLTTHQQLQYPINFLDGNTCVHNSVRFCVPIAWLRRSKQSNSNAFVFPCWSNYFFNSRLNFAFDLSLYTRFSEGLFPPKFNVLWNTWKSGLDRFTGQSKPGIFILKRKRNTKPLSTSHIEKETRCCQVANEFPSETKTCPVLHGLLYSTRRAY